MKTFMEKIEAIIEKRNHKGILSFFIYTGIFLFLAFSVIFKIAGNIFHIQKAKLK